MLIPFGMTDAAAATPLKITIYPQSALDTGRIVNANATVGTIPDNPQFWGSNDFSFKSVLDTVNPLQHIPVVSTLYQSLTGDVPSSGSAIAGDALYGGPIGLLASIANEVVKTQTGQDIGGNMLALLQGSNAYKKASALA